LPPEINSALMFTGPGSGPLLAAAAAWNRLAEGLSQSAASLWAVTSELATGAWLGASSAAMMAVASQYAAWLGTAAVQAEGAAGQATAVAGEFEAALTAAVQPAVVAANRGLVRVLAATNWLGQNAAAIADVDAAYDQMWAMDVAAMSGYHANASALLAELPSWDEVLKELDSGSIGSLGDSGSVGFGHTGSGDIGAHNFGFWNAGFGQTGWMNHGAQQVSGLLGFDNVTGASGSWGPSLISMVITGPVAASVGSPA
jgi:PPE-repeat protein